jgi:NAD+ synthase (glutamine-hydrolysing)
MIILRHYISDAGDEPSELISPVVAKPLEAMAEVYLALVMGLRDYCHKNGIERVYLGLSGGIDSTLVATVACDALGAEHVYGISNPSVYSSEHSKSDAAELAARTGCTS